MEQRKTLTRAALAVAREEQVVLLVDEDAGDAGQFGERAQKSARVAVEHLDPVGAGVGNVHPPARTVGVGVVEARLLPWRDRDEADADEAHAVWLPASTSALHQA